MGKSQRSKGHNYENYIASLFRAIGWPKAKRHLESQWVEAEEGRDLDHTFPFAVQCKAWKSTPSIMAMNQVKETEKYPVRMAVLKRTKSKGSGTIEVAVIDLPVFLAMIETLKDNGLLDCVFEE